jgi:hypothetical protein
MVEGFRRRQEHTGIAAFIRRRAFRPLLGLCAAATMAVPLQAETYTYQVRGSTSTRC